MSRLPILRPWLCSWSNVPVYWRLMRADKPIGIYLLLWPTVWALVLAAGGFPEFGLTLIFIAGVVVMRSAGCVINDYADRKVDGSVARTKQRPLVSGEVTEVEALQLFILLIAIAFVLVLFLNWQTILLSFVALLLASAYPFMKRYTHLPQVVLGAAFGWSIPMVFMAIQTQVPLWAWGLYAANLAWTVAYDTQYAMVDKADDLKVGIKSTAILFGAYDLVMIALLQIVTLLLLAWVSYINQLKWPIYLAIVAAAGLFVYQNLITRQRQPQQCFKAFLHNHWIGMTLAIGFFASTLLS